MPRTDVRGPVVTPNETDGTSFPAERLQQMIEAYEAGTSMSRIASEQQLGKEKVRKLLAAAGVRIRRQGLDDAQVQYAVRRYVADERTTRQIAEELGVGHSMVWRALRGAEVEMRPNTERTTGRGGR